MSFLFPPSTKHFGAHVCYCLFMFIKSPSRKQEKTWVGTTWPVFIFVHSKFLRVNCFCSEPCWECILLWFLFSFTKMSSRDFWIKNAVTRFWGFYLSQMHPIGLTFSLKCIHACIIIHPAILFHNASFNKFPMWFRSHFDVWICGPRSQITISS